MHRRRSVALLALFSLLAVLASATAGCAAAPRASAAAAPLTETQSTYLQTATRGVRHAEQGWWNARHGWYDARRPRERRHPLATIWDVVGLFEAVNGIAVADPTAENRRAVRRFVRGAERYFNPKLRPVGGYSPYPDSRDATTRTWFDDNGWLGLAFLDAYNATGFQPALRDAKRAMRYLDRAAWDPVTGGLWWDTRRSFRAGESLGSAVALAAGLYRATRDHTYLDMATKYMTWADASFRNEQGLYRRHEIDPVAMAYVQAPILAGQEILCEAGAGAGWCAAAATLRRLVVEAFPAPLRHGPQYDAEATRWLLSAYAYNRDPALYEIVASSGRAALVNAAGPSGRFSRAWDGGSITDYDARPGMLQTHASTLSLFAWLAATRPPRG